MLDRGRRFGVGSLVILSEFYPAVLQEEETGGGFLDLEGIERGDFWKKGVLRLNLCFFSLSKNDVDAETSTD